MNEATNRWITPLKKLKERKIKCNSNPIYEVKALSRHHCWTEFMQRTWKPR